MSREWPINGGGDMSPEAEWFRNLQPMERLRMDMLIDQYRPKPSGFSPIGHDWVMRGQPGPARTHSLPRDAQFTEQKLATQQTRQVDPQAAPPWYNQDGQLNKFEDDPNSRHITQIPSEEQQPDPKVPIGVTTRNDAASAPDTDRAIDQRLADALERAAEDIVGFNINSSTGGLHGTGKPGSSPHYDGRAVDINVVGGLPITDPRVKQAADALVKHLQGNTEVDRLFGPYYNGIRGPNGDWQSLNPNFPEPRKTIHDHRTHMHVGIRPRF
ncbi:MAG: hypothetical protein K2P94_18145 [Rhodospirillaceae bacterium]|nr:hypothetical protein [Rhodospirillaceae bacterium]